MSNMQLCEADHMLPVSSICLPPSSSCLCCRWPWAMARSGVLARQLSAIVPPRCIVDAGERLCGD